MSTLIEEINRRRTFAIISHPDAGKTTLTEKFLLYGGAIAQAGVVKGKKNSRAADVRLCHRCVELHPVNSYAGLLTDVIYGKESCVVTGQSVLLAGVAQTHQKMGDGGSGGGSLVLLKPLEDVENVGHVDSFSRYEFHDI